MLFVAYSFFSLHKSFLLCNPSNYSQIPLQKKFLKLIGSILLRINLIVFIAFLYFVSITFFCYLVLYYYAVVNLQKVSKQLTWHSLFP